MPILHASIKSNIRISKLKMIPEIFLLRLVAPKITKKVWPGQFIMLKITSGLDPLLARPFSVYGVEDEDLLILYRIAGKGTRLLSQIRKGDKVTLWGPLGKGFNLNFNNPAIIAGGIGFAPLAFAAKYFEEHNHFPRYFGQGGDNEQYVNILLQRLHNKLTSSNIVEDISLLKFNKTNNLWSMINNKKSQIILPKINNFSNQMRQTISLKTNINFDLKVSSLRFSTVISGVALDHSFSKHKTIVDQFKEFLFKFRELIDGVISCGPMSMLKAIAKICDEQNIPCQVSLEAPMACGVGACFGCAIPATRGGYIQVCQEGPVMDIAQIDWDRL